MRSQLRVAAMTIIIAMVASGCDTTTAEEDSLATTSTSTETGLIMSPDHVRAGARLRTVMDGASEVPGPGDDDGAGTAELTFNPGLRRVCYDVNVSDIETPMAAHVHVGPSGVAGPVVIPLEVGDPKPNHFTGCANGVERELITNIIRNPGEYYVNVHNAPFPAGAIRGQLGH